MTIAPDSNSTADITLDVSNVFDIAGNVSSTFSTTQAVDTVAPAVAVTLDDTALNIGDTAEVTFTFSEAPVGFDLTDVTAENGSLSGLTATADPLVFTATLTPDASIEDTSNVVTVAAASYLSLIHI